VRQEARREQRGEGDSAQHGGAEHDIRFFWQQPAARTPIRSTRTP
jgi:hypothetical protein